MFGLAKKPQRLRKDYASCSGCSLCLLVCPVWRRERDVVSTPLGRAKALQHGALPTDIAASIQSCTLCGACEPVCPEEIGLVAMTLELRRQTLQPAAAQSLQARMEEQAARPLAPQARGTAVLLPGQTLRARPATLARTAALLGGAGDIPIADDDGADIALALDAGVPVPAPRLERFLRPLRGRKNIIVADGRLPRHLRVWLPRSTLSSLGVALSSLAGVRRALRSSDLYVIEPRAYHADYQRLVKYYDGLRQAAACAFNLDLQRIAIPATARSPAQMPGLAAAADTMDDSAQVRWILQGRKLTRIVVECLDDTAAFERASGLPVVHLADLADDGTP